MSFTFSPNTSILNSNGTSIANATPLPVTGNVVVTANVVAQINNFPSVFVTSNGYPTTQNVSFSNQTVYLTSNVVVNNFPTLYTVANGYPVTQNVSFSNQTVSFAPTWQLDALSSLRTSVTQASDFFVPTVDDDTFFRWSQSLTGTNSNSQFLANTSEISLSSGNTATGNAVIQTYNRYKIVPGSSHVVYSTVNYEANTTETGITRRQIGRAHV